MEKSVYIVTALTDDVDYGPHLELFFASDNETEAVKAAEEAVSNWQCQVSEEVDNGRPDAAMEGNQGPCLYLSMGMTPVVWSAFYSYREGEKTASVKVFKAEVSSKYDYIKCDKIKEK